MKLRHTLWALGLLLASPAWAEVVEESTAAVEGADTLQPTLTEESETKGVIPVDAADTLFSTKPVIPTSVFPEKTPYEQAKDELIRAHELWDKGRAEAASDTALEAYDDFTSLGRVPGVKRSIIRSYAHQAAKIYVEAGIAYVKSYTAKLGGTPEAIQEGRSRMEDLRDVAKNYPELNKQLTTAISQLSGSTVNTPKK